MHDVSTVNEQSCQIMIKIDQNDCDVMIEQFWSENTNAIPQDALIIYIYIYMYTPCSECIQAIIFFYPFYEHFI